MATFISHSPAETEALGETLGHAARRGWVIALMGGLGAGKTRMVRGVARGLEIPARVHSPSFTLVNEYDGGRLKLFHLDLFRLETRAQIFSAGLHGFLQPDGVAVIEWAERLGAGDQDPGPEGKWISVAIEILGESERKIVYDDFGA